MATGILDNIKEAVQASLNVSQMKTLTTPIIVDETEYSTVETALNAINSKSVDVDDELSAVSENPIQNKVITEEINKKLTVVDNMPTASAEFVGKQNLYVGESSGGLNKGGIYECRSDGNDGYEWVLISTADVDLSKYKKIFIGTRAEWDALTTTEKQRYDLANLTDDLAGGELIVSDAVTEGDLNPVTSNAVAKAVNYSTDEVKTGATWIDGKPIYRKVFTGLTRSSAAGQWIDTGANVTGMNIGIIICFNAYDSTIAINRNAIDMRINDGKLKYYTGFENPFDVCTLEYTKTTD